MPPPEVIGAVRRRLTAWYRRSRRDLPWRRTRDPYRIWVSETMLQQTQVATVLPYYRRFLAAFPNVRALATSRLDRVLRIWAGLGYYARARNLHRAANVVVEGFDGRFPESPEALQSLPGVGRYTAAAVASIAFDVRAAAVDGNVQRVIARLYGIRRDVRRGPGRRRVMRIAQALLPARAPGDFNQAMMELGATVCLPGAAARCGQCPLRTHCRALAEGIVDRLPPAARRAPVIAEKHVVAAIERNGRWLFVRRPPRGLWGGLWELPTQVAGDRRATNVIASEVARCWSNTAHDVDSRPFIRFRHALSHRTVEFVGHVCSIAEPSVLRGASRLTTVDARRDGARWLPISRAGDLPMSAAMRRVVDGILRRQPAEGTRRTGTAGPV